MWIYNKCKYTRVCRLVFFKKDDICLIQRQHLYVDCSGQYQIIVYRYAFKSVYNKNIIKKKN